jgi:glucose-1-phosphate adenylyltransferase
MPGTTVKKGAVVEYAIVAENAVIDEGAHVGESPEAIANLEDWGVTVIGEKVTIGKGAAVKAKEMIDTDIEGVK